jgi:hypothetical protein
VMWPDTRWGQPIAAMSGDGHDISCCRIRPLTANS